MSSYFNLKLFLLPLVVCLLSISGLTQSTYTITIDGQTNDWNSFLTNYPTHAYSHDRNNSNDNQFTQGSKDGDAISSWHWSDGQTNNKGDITNAAAVLYQDPGNLHYILAFAGDRAVNNGDAAIGFWFFKNPVTIDTASGSSYNGTFTGQHHDSDLLIVSHFTQGGGKANLLIFIWKNGGLQGPITTDSAAVNSNQQPIPGDFTSYVSSMYPVGDFFEGMIDLTYLKISPCFANFLLETRNSQSVTASLQDLTFGSFSQMVDPPTAGNGSRCGAGVVTLTATGGTGGSILWYASQTSSTPIYTGATFTPTLTATTDYYASYKTSGGCESGKTKVTGTIHALASPVTATYTILCDATTFTVTVTSATYSRTYELTQMAGGVPTQTITVSTPSTTSVAFSGLTLGKGYSIIEINDGCTSTPTVCGPGPFGGHTGSTYATARRAQPQVQEIIQQPVVTAYPNPFNDKLKFLIKSPVSGEGSLDLYNLLGQNVRNVYRGYVEKDILKTIEYRVPYSQRTNLIYLFTIGKYKTSGKLIGMK